jgi:hypothetical protein
VYENSRVMAKTGQKNVKKMAILGFFEKCRRNSFIFQEIPGILAFKTGPKST